MDALTRAAVSERIAVDERHEHAQTLHDALTDMHAIITRVMSEAAQIDPYNPSPTLALWLTEMVGPSRAIRSSEPACEMLRLLRLIQDTAVRQSIAHGSTWQQIADILGENQSNLWARYNR